MIFSLYELTMSRSAMGIVVICMVNYYGFVHMESAH